MTRTRSRKLPLTQGKFALVDAEDYERLSRYNWCLGGPRHQCPARCGAGGGRIYLARDIMKPAEGMVVMHHNYDTLDCRKANLLVVPCSQNIQHARLRKNKTSRFKGVWLGKTYKKWNARIAKDGKSYYLGYFDNETAAAKAYDAKALELYGDTAFLNLAANNETAALIDHSMPQPETKPKTRKTRARKHQHRRPNYNARSRYKGVYWHKAHGKWCSAIKHQGKTLSLGYYESEIEAAKAYDRMVRKLRGTDAYVNFPKAR